MINKKTIIYNTKHSASDVTRVVLDIDSYSSFLPYCSHSKIIWTNNIDTIRAEMEVSFATFRYRFVSEVIYEDGQIRSSLFQGTSIKTLNSKWTIKQGVVELYVEFELKNPIINRIAGSLSGQMANIMLKAFNDRISRV